MSSKPIELLDTLNRLHQHIEFLSEDIRGLGIIDGEQAEDLSVHKEIKSLYEKTLSLRGELRRRSASHLAAQLETLGLKDVNSGIKLHLGSADIEIPGWVNVDFHPAPLSMSLSWGLPFSDGSVTHVFLSHVIEHLHYPGQAGRLLKEVHRTLAIGGTVRIVVPDMKKWLKAYVEDDDAFFERRREIWNWWPKDFTRLEEVLVYGGAGPQSGGSHKFGFDYPTLEKLLRAAGFEDIRQCSYMASEEKALRIDNKSHVASATFGSAESSFSLFVEARRTGIVTTHDTEGTDGHGSRKP